MDLGIPHSLDIDAPLGHDNWKTGYQTNEIHIKFFLHIFLCMTFFDQHKQKSNLPGSLLFLTKFTFHFEGSKILYSVIYK